MALWDEVVGGVFGSFHGYCLQLLFSGVVGWVGVGGDGGGGVGGAFTLALSHVCALVFL